MFFSQYFKKNMVIHKFNVNNGLKINYNKKSFPSLTIL